MADPRPADEPLGFQVARLDGRTWLVLAVGLGLAALCLAVPMLRWVLSYLTILIHEFGHAVVGWLFGYPSLPAFDFTYGGGLTSHQSRSMLLLGLVYVVLVGLLPAYRRNRTTLIVLLVGLGLFALLAHTDGHQVLILFMGHGAELLLAGVFLYRALSGSAVVHAAERPLYAACGFFIVLSDTRFGYRLWTSPQARAAYGAAKGGGHWMDFTRIARDHLHVELPAVALFFLLCCVVPLVASYLVFRYRDWVFDWLARRFEREPAA